MRIAALALLAVWLLACGSGDSGEFGLTQIATPDGRTASIGNFYTDRACGLCHTRQLREASGSMHSVAHTDPLYRAFALLAKEEAGDEVYGWCSGCHSAAGVVSGYLPGMPDSSLPAEVKAGVSCDVCHQISGENWSSGPFDEPGNASFVLSPGHTKFGNIGNIEKHPAHDSQKIAFISTPEYCATCHSVIHPMNGLRVEHTYGEWKKSIYAEKGIRCQDCHMRTPADAVRIAKSLSPITERGFALPYGPERDVHPHWFVGANVDARTLSGSAVHAVMAEARLKSAATISLDVPDAIVAGGTLPVTAIVANVAAGHGLPTALTELREMWIMLEVLDADGGVLFEIGILDDHGEVSKGAVRFGAALADAEGKETFRAWEAVTFLWRRQVPPRGETRDVIEAKIPAGARGPLTLRAKLLYRTAPPHVVREVMKERAFVPRVVEMCRAEAVVAVR